MRTTLEIDDDILQVAKELARAENKTAGRILSELARKALTTPSESLSEEMVLKNGFYVRPGRGGAVVTTELVNQILDAADMDDAGFKGT